MVQANGHSNLGPLHRERNGRKLKKTKTNRKLQSPKKRLLKRKKLKTNAKFKKKPAKNLILNPKLS